MKHKFTQAELLEGKITKAYNAYIRKINEYESKGYKLRETINKDRFAMGYINYKEGRYTPDIPWYGDKGRSKKAFYEQLALQSVVFTYTEAMSIARTIRNSTEALSIFSNIKYNKDNTINVNDLANKITQLSSSEAGRAVALWIDLGLYEDGRNFEGFTY